MVAGVMLHHAEMDDLDRLDELLALLARHDRVEARRMVDV
jgi:hypothetical protein